MTKGSQFWAAVRVFDGTKPICVGDRGFDGTKPICVGDCGFDVGRKPILGPLFVVLTEQSQFASVIVV